MNLNTVKAAILAEGPRPLLHAEVMRRHRREWPTLWMALDSELGFRHARLTREVQGLHAGHLCVVLENLPGPSCRVLFLDEDAPLLVVPEVALEVV